MLLHLGRVPTVVVSSAEPAKVILKTHDIVISNRPDSSISTRLLYDYKNVSLPLYGDYWRQMRSLNYLLVLFILTHCVIILTICALHLLNLKRVQSFRYVRDEEINSMTHKIKESCSSSSPVKICKYLKAVIMESFRLHLPLRLLVLRESTEDVKVKGYDILAKTRLIFDAWAIGRSGYPGITFPVAAIELALASLLYHFDWTVPGEASGQHLEVPEASGILVHRKFPLVAVP
ncbi:hypothetical protein CICLE_v10023575mg, partial [Citrus x clementina]